MDERGLAEQFEAARDDPEAWDDVEKVPPKRKSSERRQRGVVASVRLTVDELATLQAYAGHVGSGISGALREAGLAAAKRNLPEPFVDEWLLDLRRAMHPFPEWVLEEFCTMCGDPAAHKIGEDHGSLPFHELTNYLCCWHFKAAVGNCDNYPYESLAPRITEVDYTETIRRGTNEEGS